MLPFYLDFSLYVYVVAYVKYKGKYIIYRMCSVVRVFSVVFDSLLPQAL